MHARSISERAFRCPQKGQTVNVTFPPFSIGSILAIIVLVLVVVALVFAAAMPAWLPLVLIGALALARLT